MAEIRAERDEERKTRKAAKEKKKQEIKQKKAKAVAAFEKEKTEKLPGIKDELVTLREVRNYKKVVMNRLKEILIFYYDVTKKDVQNLNKPDLIEMLQSKFDAEEDRDKEGDQPSTVTMAFGTLI